MQGGNLVAGIPEWTVTARVGSTVRVAESVSIDAELPSDMPDAIGGVSGVTARTGTIVWAAQDVVESRPYSPWARSPYGWPPSPGQSVGIWVGDESTAWKVFTGVIDYTRGDAGKLESRIIDVTDRLDRDVSIPPVGYLTPSYYDETTGGSADASVWTEVQPWYAAYKCLRVGGFGVPVPVQSDGALAVAVDFQGSIYPDRGYLRSSVERVQMEWGEGWTYLSNGVARYHAFPHQVASTSALRLWMRWNATAGGTASLAVIMDDGRQIRLDGTLNGVQTHMTLRMRVWASDPDSGGSLLADQSVTRAAMVEDGTVWVDAIFPVSSGTVRYTVAENSIESGTTNGAVEQSLPLGSGPSAGSIPEFASTWGPQVAVRVGVMTLSQWRAMSSHVPSTRIFAWGRGLVRSQHTSRAIEGRSARDVLRDIGASTLTSMWVDETGVMQWAPSNLLYSQSPVKTVTTTQDIFSLIWEESMLSTRHQVKVKYLRGAMKRSLKYGVTLYQPSSASAIEKGTPDETFIEVPSDEEWFGLDASVALLSGEPNITAFSEGHRSFRGGIYEDSGGLQRWAGPLADFPYTMESLGLRTWLLTQTYNGPASEISQVTKTGDAESYLKRQWRGQNLPIIRGRARTVFSEAWVASSRLGPDAAPDLEFDMGAWGFPGDANRVADWLAERLTTTLITLTNLEIEYDPRLQLGDVITVDSSDFLGFSVDCLIIAKTEQHGEGSFMTCTVRVIRVRTTVTTYTDFESKHSNSTYSALEATWAGATYAQLESNPLGG